MGKLFITYAGQASWNSSKSIFYPYLFIELTDLLVDRSSLLRVLETLVFSPLLMMEATRQKQMLEEGEYFAKNRNIRSTWSDFQSYFFYSSPNQLSLNSKSILGCNKHRS